jgi:hypothetical protein
LPSGFSLISAYYIDAEDGALSRLLTINGSINLFIISHIWGFIITGEWIVSFSVSHRISNLLSITTGCVTSS